MVGVSGQVVCMCWHVATMSDLYMKRFIRSLSGVCVSNQLILSELVLITTDLKGVVKTVNQPFEYFTGFKLDDCVNLKCNFLQLKDDLRNRKANCQVKEHISRRMTSPCYVKFFNITKSNTPFVMYCRISPILIGNKIVGFYSLGSPLLELILTRRMSWSHEEYELRKRSHDIKRHHHESNKYRTKNLF